MLKTLVLLLSADKSCCLLACVAVCCLLSAGTKMSGVLPYLILPYLLLSFGVTVAEDGDSVVLVVDHCLCYHCCVAIGVGPVPVVAASIRKEWFLLGQLLLLYRHNSSVTPVVVDTSTCCCGSDGITTYSTAAAVRRVAAAVPHRRWRCWCGTAHYSYST